MKKTTSSFLPRRSIQAVCLSSLMCLAGQSYGAGTEITAITGDGSYGLTSVTIGGTTFSSLTGSTASITNLTGNGDTVSIWVPGSTPVPIGGVDAASSSLNYGNSAANAKTTSIFQFGRTITASDNIFIFDFGIGDAAVFQLVNSSNIAVGNYQISTIIGDYGSDLTPAGESFASVDIRKGDGSTGTATVNSIVGVSFKISDMTELSAGDLSTVTGIKILSSHETLDPAIVGLATIPEPGTYALLAGLTAFAFIALRRRS